MSTTTTTELPRLRPRTLGEALAARAAHPDWTVLAGGTDLMVGAAHRPPPAGVLDLFGLPALRGVTALDGRVRIGSGTTYATLLADPLVRERFPCLRAACAEVGALQIQARGTVGGNMATSSPVGDTLPPLLALDAVVVLASTAGERRVPYHAFPTGYRKVDLRPDELIVAIELPDPAPGAVQVWRKVGTRKAQAISKVMLAAVGHTDAAGRVARARVALGAVADRPIRLPAVEELLVGQAPGPELAARAEAAVRAAISPITDVRSTREYRLDVAARLVAGFVRALEGTR